MGHRRYTEEQFREAVADPTVTTIAELCRRLGLVPSGGNYESVRALAHTLDIASDLLDGQRSGRTRHALVDLSDRDRVAQAVAQSRSLAAAIRALGGDVTKGNYQRLRSHLVLHDVPTDHMAGQGWARGLSLPQSRVPAAELFDRRRVSTSKLRRKLILEGYKDHQCERCDRTTWQGHPVPLELDHIDGDRTNNRLENLRVLCPNCHALTPTYRGRNIGQTSTTDDS